MQYIYFMLYITVNSQLKFAMIAFHHIPNLPLLRFLCNTCIRTYNTEFILFLISQLQQEGGNLRLRRWKLSTPSVWF